MLILFIFKQIVGMRIPGRGEGGGYFRWQGWSNWGKIKTPKNPWAKNKPLNYPIPRIALHSQSYAAVISGHYTKGTTTNLQIVLNTQKIPNFTGSHGPGILLEKLLGRWKLLEFLVALPEFYEKVLEYLRLQQNKFILTSKD